MVTALFSTNWASELLMAMGWYSIPRSSTAVRKPFPGPAWILSHSRRIASFMPISVPSGSFTRPLRSVEAFSTPEGLPPFS